MGNFSLTQVRLRKRENSAGVIQAGPSFCAETVRLSRLRFDRLRIDYGRRAGSDAVPAAAHAGHLADAPIAPQVRGTPAYNQGLCN